MGNAHHIGWFTKAFVSASVVLTTLVAGSTVSLAEEQPADVVEDNSSSKDGWIDLQDNNKGYLDDGALVLGWHKIDESSYYFNEDGIMCTGWKNIEDKDDVVSHYFRPSGILASGWADIDGSKYWFDQDGIMATGWKEIEGKAYYFDVEGRMLVGWQDVADESGEVRHLFFRPSGSLATGWATMDDGSKYYFNESGEVTTGMALIDDKPYLFDANGRMLIGRQTIEGFECYFRPSGVMDTDDEQIVEKLRSLIDKGVINVMKAVQAAKPKPSIVVVDKLDIEVVE